MPRMAGADDTHSVGAIPDGGFAPLVPEIAVRDLAAALDFWTGILGFRIAYAREGFAYLEHPDGAQVMLGAFGRCFAGAAPGTRGLMLQITVRSLDPVIAAMDAAGIPLHTPPGEVTRRTGDRDTTRREVRLRDPDGTLVLLAEPPR